jgi:hypothetical protein
MKNVLASSVEAWFKYRYSSFKTTARKSGITFTITREELCGMFEEQKGLCFYTDVPMRTDTGLGWNPNALSLDKVVPEKGYIPGNVVLCTRRANTVKSDLTLEEMKLWMPPWYKRLEEKLL